MKYIYKLFNKMGKRKRTRAKKKIQRNEEDKDIEKDLNDIANPKIAFYSAAGSKNY